jgi:hypothetical protein
MVVERGSADSGRAVVQAANSESPTQGADDVNSAGEVNAVSGVAADVGEGTGTEEGAGTEEGDSAEEAAGAEGDALEYCEASKSRSCVVRLKPRSAAHIAAAWVAAARSRLHGSRLH